MPADETVDNFPNGEAHAKDGTAPETDNADGSIFDNMTPDELKAAFLEKEKSYKELHSKVGQMSGELGQLRQLRKEMEGESKLADAVSAVKALVADKDKKPEFDYEAYEASLAEKMAENPAEAAKDLLRTVNSWMNQDRAKLKGESVSEIQALKAQLKELSEAVETTTPDYNENKELIEKLRSKGMSIKDAKAFAKEIRETMPQGERRIVPTGINPTRVASSEKSKPVVSKDDIERWKSEGRSEDFIANMMWKRERDAKLTQAEKENF